MTFDEITLALVNNCVIDGKKPILEIFLTNKGIEATHVTPSYKRRVVDTLAPKATKNFRVKPLSKKLRLPMVESTPLTILSTFEIGSISATFEMTRT